VTLLYRKRQHRSERRRPDESTWRNHRVLVEDLPHRHLKCGERLYFAFENGVLRNFLGMQLLVDPLLHAEALYLLDVSGPRPERQSIQNMERLFIERDFLIKPAGGV